MPERGKVLDEIRAALRSELRSGSHGHLNLKFDGDDLVLEGVVADVADKKRVLRRAAAHPAIGGIVDRVRIRPEQPMGDGELCDAVARAMLQEPAFLELALATRVRSKQRVLREPPERRRGAIEVAVADGVVTLTGEAPSLSHKRLSGVLAWWVPGTRDVVNGLGVEPAEEDNDGEITDAVRLVLEKDPLVNSSQISVTTRGDRVTLRGLVPTDEERHMAEFDTWCVLGVDEVINEIAVAPVKPTGRL